MNIFSSTVDFKVNNNKLAECINLTLHFFTLQVFSFGFILKLSYCSERKGDKTQIDHLRLSSPIVFCHYCYFEANVVHF